MFPSHRTMEPSGMTTGPSGKPRFEASRVPSTGVLSGGLTREIGMRAYQSVIQPRTTGHRAKQYGPVASADSPRLSAGALHIGCPVWESDRSATFRHPS